MKKSLWSLQSTNQLVMDMPDILIEDKKHLSSEHNLRAGDFIKTHPVLSLPFQYCFESSLVLVPTML